jgi:succinate dehydrogenase / fumarate reductase membrane anchor subunit
MSDFRTALGRARGLGSAKHGVGHFIGQRVSAVALLALTLWGVASALSVAGGGYDGARTWLASPVNATLLSLLIIVGVYHAGLGLRTIIEDYIERPVTKAGLLVLNAFVGWGAAALAVVSILKVTFGAGS